MIVKSFQFAIDSTPLFYNDSGAFIVNALGLGFIPERSYVYGGLIRVFALPFHSLPAIVGMQTLMGGLTAWLLALILVRFLRVRAGISVGDGTDFRFRPAAKSSMSTWLRRRRPHCLRRRFSCWSGFSTCGKPSLWLLVIISFLGALLVSLRTVYVPVVATCAAALPVIAYFRMKKPGRLVLALAVSCGSMILCQIGYMHLTGWLAGREPAYHYQTGLFQMGVVAPIIEAQDSDDRRVSEAVVEQNQSSVPLSNHVLRPAQVWAAGGLAERLRSVFHGDKFAANRAAERLARNAILRNPLGFLRLGFDTYLDFWRVIPRLRWRLAWESGAQPRPVLNTYDIYAIQRGFGVDVSNQHLWRTPSRRYHALGRWGLFLLASPFLMGLAMYLDRDNQRGAVFLFAWTWLSLIAMCLGASEPAFRYLHPFSFTGLAAVGMLAQTGMRRLSDR